MSFQLTPLFESERFSVVCIDFDKVIATVGRDETGRLLYCGFRRAQQIGFEVYDKQALTVSYLQDGMSEAFQAQTQAWRANPPSTEEVEDVLALYARICALPLTQH